MVQCTSGVGIFQHSGNVRICISVAHFIGHQKCELSGGSLRVGYEALLYGE